MTDVSFLMQKRTKPYRPIAGDVRDRQSREVEMDSSIKERPMADLRDYL
jgi:hypothetical protein